MLQHLGATDGFIRRPFLYLGAWYGLAAGALAIGLLTLAAIALRAPLATLAASYGSDFALDGFAPATAAGVVVGAAVLGWLGGGVVTGHFLRQTRPTDTWRSGTHEHTCRITPWTRNPPPASPSSGTSSPTRRG